MRQRNERRLDRDALWEYALRAISGRAHSISEIRDKLRRRAARLEDVPDLLARLKSYGYLDDRQFAETFAAARLENQGFGRARVLRDLRVRRIAPKVAEHAVQEAFRETDEVQLIESFLARKYRRVSLGEFLADPKNLAAAYRKLRLAGFSSGNTLCVLKRHAREPEVLDGLEEAEEQAE